MKILKTILGALSVYVLLVTIFVGSAFAHCDTLDGPVVAEARIALEKADVTPLLKWVAPEKEQVIQAAFQKTLAMRVKGDDARKFADTYFFETLVRIHREGEGAPYTGLKPAETIDPAVAMADKALETGDIDELIKVLSDAMANGIRTRFKHARDTQQHVDDSVITGREFIESYVILTHYAEGLHSQISEMPAHHGQSEAGH